MVFISLLGYSEYHADLLNGQPADGTSAELVVLVVVVLVAVVEVLIPSPAGLGPIVLSTLPGRLFSGETAPDLSCALQEVSVVRMSVAS